MPLEQTILNIKDLKLENVGASIVKMTEDLNDLTSDLEKEQTGFSSI